MLTQCLCNVSRFFASGIFKAGIFHDPFLITISVSPHLSKKKKKESQIHQLKKKVKRDSAKF